MRNGKNVTIYVSKELAEDEDLKQKVYALYGRSGFSGLMTSALERIKEKGKL